MQLLLCSLSLVLLVKSQPFPPPRPPQLQYNGTFLILASQTLKPNEPYQLQLLLLKQDSSLKNVRLQLVDAAANVTLGSLTVSPVFGRTTTANFPPLSLNQLSEQSAYHLKATGQDAQGRTLWERQEYLNANGKVKSIFVQLDKPIYKPGSTVKYRVIVVSESLKPETGTVTLRIVDPNDNIIRQLTNQRLDRGVLSGELPLAEEPPLGKWRIRVESGREKFEKTFTVDEYVLPKFELKLEPPAYIHKDEDLLILVKAKYTHGKDVSGQVTVRLGGDGYYPGPINVPPMMIDMRRPFGGPPLPQRPQQQQFAYQTTVALNPSGEAVVRIPNSVLKSAFRSLDYERTAFIEGTFTESLTNATDDASAQVTIYPDKYRLDFTNPEQNYRPGLENTQQIALTLPDRSPIGQLSPGRNVRLTYTTYFSMDSPIPFPQPLGGQFLQPMRENKQIRVETISLNPDGTKSFSFVPALNSSSVEIEAEYSSMNNLESGALISRTKYLSPFRTDSKQYLQLIPGLGVPKKVPIGSTVTYSISKTDVFPNPIHVMVTARGRIVQVQELQASNSKLSTFSFRVTPNMVPRAQIIAYTFLNKNKEILADGKELAIDGLTQNKVTVSVANPGPVEPGSQAQIRVDCVPNSFVGLRAVDQSVYLMKTDPTDLKMNMIEEELRKYTGYGYFSMPWANKRRKRMIAPWYYGGSDSASVIRGAGLIFMTDAIISPGGGGFGCPNCGGGFGGPFQPVPEIATMGGPPPNAIPDLQQGTGAPPQTSSEAPVRTSFPETWIWADISAQFNGQAGFSAKVPDSITSWVIDAFALDQQMGLGVAEQSANLTVYKPFFIRLNLPYSVKRGEELGLQVIIFNYMQSKQMVTVTLEQNGSFNFVDQNGRVSTGGVNTRQKMVSGNGATDAVYFPIVANTIGDIKLRVRAQSAGAGDAVERVLLVRPEGFRVEKNHPVTVDLSQNGSFEEQFQPVFPPDVVPGSEKTEFAVIGDIMGPALENLDNLVRMPTGCGEQNMVLFTPNIVAIRYLKATNQLQPELEAKAKRFMETGYQRELTYKLKDGSFSAFGERDKHGSTWLTAFVLRWFQQAKPYIFVDEKVLKEAGDFLLEQQKSDGSFGENGEVHSKRLQGSSGEGGVPLTAFVLIALLENKRSNPRGLAYIERNLNSISNDPYALSLSAYLLQLANSRQKDTAYQLLQQGAISDAKGKYWKDAVLVESQDTVPPYWEEPNPADVEMTGYALLTELARNGIVNTLPIVRWLSSQRNAYGGFSSTQDTVIGLHSIGAYAEKAYTGGVNAAVRVISGPQIASFNVNSQNLFYQSEELTNPKAPIQIKATGSGVLSAQISWKFNLKAKQRRAPFDCTPSVTPASGKSLNVGLCCRKNDFQKSNMAVMEIEALSGFAFDQFQLKQLTRLPDLQRTELEHGGSKANIYFNSLGITPVCFNLSSQQDFAVGNQKPAQILLFDYYNPVERIELEYSNTGSFYNNGLKQTCPQCWSDIPRFG